MAKKKKHTRFNKEQIDAKMMANGFSFKKIETPEEQINRSWDNFSAKLNEDSNEAKYLLPLRKKRVLQIAATLLLLVTFIWGLQKFKARPNLLVFHTNQNETRLVELPDGSSLLLNTNSSVSYYDNWLKQKKRRLKLEGEAYVKVIPQPKGSTFSVQSNDLTVEVIGTAFNFNSKRKNAIVSLVEGEINLIKSDYGGQVLKAGQTAQFNEAQNAFEITSDKTEYWKSWTRKEWALGEGMPMSEILERIGETYGLDYKVTDKSILQKKASGDISIESQEVLLEALSVLLGLEMSVENGQLIISIQEEN